MKKSGIVEEYLDNINKQLSGFDKRIKKSVLDELESHISEKSEALAVELEKTQPDEGIIKKVIEDLGTPYDVASEYIKTLPKKPDGYITSLLYLQIFIGLFSIIVGSALLFNEIHRGIIDTYIEFYGEMAISVAITNLIPYFLFILFGFIILIMALTQVWEYTYLQKYGLISMGFAFFVGIGSCIGTINKLVYWYFFKVQSKPKDYEELTSYYSYIQSIEAIGVLITLIIFLLIFIIGIFHLHKFQKLLATERIEYEKEKNKKRVRNKALIVSYITLISIMIVVNILVFILVRG